MTKALVILSVVSLVLIAGVFWVAQRDAAKPPLVPEARVDAPPPVAPPVVAPTPRRATIRRPVVRGAAAAAKAAPGASRARHCAGAYSATDGTNFGACIDE